MGWGFRGVLPDTGCLEYVLNEKNSLDIFGKAQTGGLRAKFGKAAPEPCLKACLGIGYLAELP